MPTFFDAAVRARFESRVRAIHPGSTRRWGRMSPHEALCHLADGFRMVLGDKPVAPRPRRFRGVVRFTALRLPLPWPRGIPTFAELEQGRGGTRPEEFERDREALLALMARFAAAGPGDLAPAHEMFGPMRHADWGVWAYRHLDHHLTQFGI